MSLCSFSRCQNLTKLNFELVETTSGFFYQCILPRADHYTSMTFSSCLTVQNENVAVSFVILSYIFSDYVVCYLLSYEIFVKCLSEIE